MTLTEIARYFFRLGLTGFGGPIALIQQMRQDFVRDDDGHRNDGKMTRFEFDQAFTIIKAMPGPIAFQMAVFCGKTFGQFAGALIAGVGIIFPAFCIIVAIAYFYESFIENSFVAVAVMGVQYAVAAVILVGLHKLSRSYHGKMSFWIFSILAGSCFYLQLVPEALLIVGTGIFFVVAFHIKRSAIVSWGPVFFLDFSRLPEIFFVCFKTGAFVFGTGLAAFPFLESAFVKDLGWLNLKVFSDAVSFGQMTPGPVTIATAFMGFKMAGIAGAITATLGLFLPAFFHITTWFSPALGWLNRQKWIDHFVAGATAAVIGCVFITTAKMNRDSLDQPFFWLTFAPALLALVFLKRVSIFFVIVGASFWHVLIYMTIQSI